MTSDLERNRTLFTALGYGSMPSRDLEDPDGDVVSFDDTDPQASENGRTEHVPA